MATPADTPSENQNLITLADAADILAVDYETARRWIVLKGAIPHVRVGPTDVIRVYRKDVLSLIRQTQ